MRACARAACGAVALLTPVALTACRGAAETANARPTIADLTKLELGLSVPQPPEVTGDFKPPHPPLPAEPDPTADPIAEPYRAMVAAVHDGRPLDAVKIAVDVSEAAPEYYYAAYYAFGLYASQYATHSENRDTYWGQTAIADGYYHLWLLDRLAHPASERYADKAVAAFTRALELGHDQDADPSYLHAALASLTRAGGDNVAAAEHARQAIDLTRAGKRYNTALVDYYALGGDAAEARREYQRQIGDHPEDWLNMSPASLAAGIAGDLDAAGYKRYAMLSAIESQLVFMDITKRVAALREELDRYLKEMNSLRGKPDEMAAFLAVVLPQLEEFGALLREVLRQATLAKSIADTFKPGQLPRNFVQLADSADDFSRLDGQIQQFIEMFRTLEQKLSTEKGQPL